jgi:TRAP-type mannitol/chloroaromatic compound transport system permease small subunit
VTEFLPAIMFGVFTVLIMLGYPVMLERSGLAEDLLETMALVFGRLPGGIAISVVVVGILLAATTAIVGATVTMMGGVTSAPRIPRARLTGLEPPCNSPAVARSFRTSRRLVRVLRELARKIDAIQEPFGRAVSWLTTLMVAVVFTDVVMRYTLNRTYVFTQELEWYLFGIVYLLAAGYTMLHDEHVRVDIVYSKMSPTRKAWVDFILLLVFFFPSCLLVVYTSWPFVRNSWSVWESSPDPGGIPARWALKSVIIIGFVILMIQGVSELIKRFYVARGWEQPAGRVKEIL